MVALYQGLARPAPGGARCACGQPAAFRRTGVALAERDQCVACYVADLQRPSPIPEPIPEPPSTPAPAAPSVGARAPVVVHSGIWGESGALVVGGGVVVWRGRRVPMSRQRASFLAVLMEARGEWVERPVVARRLWGLAGATEMQTLRATLHALHRCLPGLIEVKTGGNHYAPRPLRIAATRVASV